MLEPDPVPLLTEGGVLAKCCDEDVVGKTEEPSRGEAAEGSPFNFSPQLIHLHKDHELFEVAQETNTEPTDILTHLYTVMVT